MREEGEQAAKQNNYKYQTFITRSKCECFPYKKVKEKLGDCI